MRNGYRLTVTSDTQLLSKLQIELQTAAESFHYQIIHIDDQADSVELEKYKGKSVILLNEIFQPPAALESLLYSEGIQCVFLCSQAQQQAASDFINTYGGKYW